MSGDDGKSLWVKDKEEFFLVPDDVALPAGETEIRSLTGLRRRVDAAALAAYAISGEDAHARVQAKAQYVADAVRGALGVPRESARGSDEGDGHEGDPAGAGSSGAAAGSIPSADAIEATLRPHLEAFQHGLERMAVGFRDAMAEATRAFAVPAPLTTDKAPGSPARPVADDPLRRAGANFASALRAIPEELGRVARSPEMEKLLRDAASKLQSIAADLHRDRESGASAGDEARPASDEVKPASDEARPTSDEARPASDEARPASDDPKLATDEAKAAVDEPKPA